MATLHLGSGIKLTATRNVSRGNPGTPRYRLDVERADFSRLCMICPRKLATIYDSTYASSKPRLEAQWSHHASAVTSTTSPHQHFAYGSPPPPFDHSPTTTNFPSSMQQQSPMSVTHSPLSATFSPMHTHSIASRSAQHEVLPSGYQSYSPDPYSGSPALVHPLPANSSAPISRSITRTGTTKHGCQQLPTPALSSSSIQSVPPPERLAETSSTAYNESSSAYPAYSSSHTYSYPNTAYPPHSASGSSSSARSESAISPASVSGTFPPGSMPSSVALMAATNRRRMADAKAAQHYRGEGDAGETADSPALKKPSMSVRQAVELDFACHFCGRPLAKLTLRGKDVQVSGRHDGTYYCRVCVPLPYTPAQPTGTLGHNEEEATYADTISAAADRLEGINIDLKDTRPPPASRGTNGAVGTSKKRKNPDAEVLTCDVCHRDLGTGGIHALSGEIASGKDCTIEVLCTHCEKTYFRCSDCGGGGGNRGCVEV